MESVVGVGSKLFEVDLYSLSLCGIGVVLGVNLCKYLGLIAWDFLALKLRFFA